MKNKAIENHIYNQIQHHQVLSSIILRIHLTISKLYREEEKNQH